MSIKVVIETDVARPIDAVFAALVDLDEWPAWLIATGIIKVTRSTAAPPAAGDRLTIDQRAAGRASTVEATVTALEAPTRFVVAGKDADGIKTELDAALRSVEAGHTRLRWSARIDVPLRYRIFESMAAPQVQRAAALDIEAFKRRLETAPGD
jgi:uncharacterized protein YndB with AHSA1/START domain